MMYEIARRCFASLNREGNPEEYGNMYYLLNDHYYDTKFFAMSDEEAIEKWRKIIDRKKVLYESGESRYWDNVVDYMLVWVDDTELYAECPVGETEDASYEALKSEILSQAADNNISADCLRFWFD